MYWPNDIPGNVYHHDEVSRRIQEADYIGDSTRIFFWGWYGAFKTKYRNDDVEWGLCVAQNRITLQHVTRYYTSNGMTDAVQNEKCGFFIGTSIDTKRFGERN
jgi:hypothetical protein